QRITESGNVSLLQKADQAGGRENAISLGRARPPISRRAWRDRHHQRGTLSPGYCRCCATAKRNAPTFDHNLSASEHRRVRAKAGGENAGRPESLLFRELRLGS